MYQYVSQICNQSTQLQDKTICTNMYQYVSQHVINLHNLRMKQYVPRCTNMYHNM